MGINETINNNQEDLSHKQQPRREIKQKQQPRRFKTTNLF